MVNGHGFYTNLPDNWSIVRIRELTADYRAHLQTGPFGTNLLASEYKAIGTPVVAVKNIQHNRLILDTDIPRVDEETHKRLANYEIKAGDIIFGRKGAVDRCALVMPSQDGWLQGSDCIRLRFLSQDILPEFVSLVFQLPQHIQWMTSHAIGSTMPSLNQSILSGISIPLPPLPEQRKIAEILSTWDEGIQLVEALITALKARKQGLMQLLLTGEVRFPGFNEPWEEVRLGDVANLVAGGTPSTTNQIFWNGDVKWMRSSDVHKRRIYNVEGRITEEGLKNSSAQFVPENSVLVALAGQGKTRGTVAINKVELSTNQSVAAIIPDAMELFYEYLFANLEFRYEELRQLSTGAGGRGGLNLAILKAIKLLKPAIDEQICIADILEVCDQQADILSEYKHHLREQKKGLMQRLLTGEVRVKVEG